MQSASVEQQHNSNSSEAQFTRLRQPKRKRQENHADANVAALSNMTRSDRSTTSTINLTASADSGRRHFTRGRARGGKKITVGGNNNRARHTHGQRQYGSHIYRERYTSASSKSTQSLSTQDTKNAVPTNQLHVDGQDGTHKRQKKMQQQHSSEMNALSSTRT